ncbi:MAG: DinB family protein [Mucilaginibacter sp.]|uniref:DinB family protein n=1 Tax=Mucilaginibacter sp. TaxID=1882438 RepID=UPI0031AF9BDB
MVAVFKKIFLRDLAKLKTEIELYRDEQKIWHAEKQITNSAGTLCVHLIGSLNHFIGAQLGNTDYIRKRDLEFLPDSVPRAELLKRLDETILVVAQTFDNLTDAQLEEEYPQLLFDEKVSTNYLLTHVVSHLNYHLGQVNYHRRLLDN